MAKDIPDLDDQGFDHYNSLMHFYMYCDLDKAEKLAEEMMEIDFKAANMKKLRFSFANLMVFKRDYEEAMSNYQQVLKMIPDDHLRAYTMNNMAATGSYKKKSPSTENTTSADDTESIINAYKESLGLLENLPQNKLELGKQTNKFSEEARDEILSTNSIIPENYSHETEKEYLGVLTNVESGKVITNISEYLLMNENTNPQNISFWFKLGLDLYENRCPHLIDRHLILLAAFYSSNRKLRTAEELFRQALKKMKKETNYTKAMGLNMYGRMLQKHPKRRDQGMVYLQQSEQLMSILPHWYDKVDNLFLYDDKW